MISISYKKHIIAYNLIKPLAMIFQKKQHLVFSAILLFSISLFSGCLTSKKMEAFVAAQYNNQLPKPDKKKNTDITVSTSITTPTDAIATSYKKTTNVLPLLFYWEWDYRRHCVLNPAIGVNHFTKTLNQQANKGLTQKLNGGKLDLVVEEVPAAFALADKAHMIWLVLYAISWDKIYIEPDFKNLVVSYKFSQNGTEIKTGKIAIKNNQENKNLRFFQSWKTATTEFLTRYNIDISDMTKSFVTELMAQL